MKVITITATTGITTPIFLAELVGKGVACGAGVAEGAVEGASETGVIEGDGGPGTGVGWPTDGEAVGKAGSVQHSDENAWTELQRSAVRT